MLQHYALVADGVLLLLMFCALSVSPLDTEVNPTKADEPTVVVFGMWTWGDGAEGPMC